MEFEARVKKIKEILEKLNEPNLSLKDGMELFKNGTEELKAAQKMLDEARILYNEIKDAGRDSPQDSTRDSSEDSPKDAE